MDDLRGKVALITGSTSGIGRAAAIALARYGAKTVVHGQSEQRGADTVAAIAAEGGEAHFVRMNLAEPDAAQRLVEVAAERWGRLDIVVNNAALICNKPIEQVRHEDWDSLFAVNVKAPFFVVQAALPWFDRVGGGTVVNVSSTNRLVNSPDNVVYDAMKAALNHMTRGLSLDLRLAGRNVRVNAVMPGGTATPLLDKWLDMQHMSAGEKRELYEREAGKIGTPEQIADAIAFLASERSGWINGGEIPVDGGHFLG